MSKKDQEITNVSSTGELSDEQLKGVSGGIVIDITGAGIKSTIYKPKMERPADPSFGGDDLGLL